MGILYLEDILPDGLTAGLAGHCQPDTKYPESWQIDIIAE